MLPKNFSAGTEVEVYHHTAHGWCAIRPLETSYSWVSGRYLRVRKDGLATVLADRVPSRIGSQSGEIGDAVQVHLQRGESVELLGTKQVRDGAGTTTWYKIAPPSGEFRWIHAKYLEPETPDEGVRRTSTEISPPHRRLSPTAPPRDLAEEQTDQGSKTGVGKMDRTATPQPLPWIYERREPSPGAGDQTQSPALPRELHPSPLAGQNSPATAEQSLPFGPDAYRAAIDDINAQLSTIIAQEPSKWHFDALARRIDSLAAQAQTSVQRGQARLLADRVAAAHDIQQRYEVAEANREKLPSAEVDQAREIANSQRRADRYDGVGRLQPVRSNRLGVPSYALTDEEGEVRYYVNAAPGLNMRPYVGHEIAINGIRDLADPNAPIITAKHVTVLDDQRLR